MPRSARPITLSTGPKVSRKQKDSDEDDQWSSPAPPLRPGADDLAHLAANVLEKGTSASPAVAFQVVDPGVVCGLHAATAIAFAITHFLCLLVPLSLPDLWDFMLLLCPAISLCCSKGMAGELGFEPRSSVLETDSLTVELTPPQPSQTRRTGDSPPESAPSPSHYQTAYLVSLWSVCLRQVLQNFENSSLPVVVFLFLVVE